jgi:LAGLIDADG endonuclease
MLEQVQSFFGEIGSIGLNIADNTLSYSVYGLKNCLIIREHFFAYPLMTYKLVYFLLWYAVIDIMVSGAHLTWEGLLRIVAYKAHFKKGLSVLLTAAFHDFIPIPVFLYKPNLSLMNINWIVGLINADGSFSVIIRQANDTLLGERSSLEINIVQHKISLISLIALQHAAGLLSCGAVKSKGDIPFRDAKQLDYADFCKVVDLINSKAHLTRAGLDAIKGVSAGMNSNRTDFGSN